MITIIKNRVDRTERKPMLMPFLWRVWGDRVLLVNTQLTSKYQNLWKMCKTFRNSIWIPCLAQKVFSTWKPFNWFVGCWLTCSASCTVFGLTCRSYEFWILFACTQKNPKQQLAYQLQVEISTKYVQTISKMMFFSRFHVFSVHPHHFLTVNTPSFTSTTNSRQELINLVISLQNYMAERCWNYLKRCRMILQLVIWSMIWSLTSMLQSTKRIPDAIRHTEML